jgi:hypothetical protein
MTIQNIYFSYLHPKHSKQSTLLLFLLSYFILSSFTCFITIFYLLTRNLVLDNHTVELGTQDFILLCRIARRREGETTICSIIREFDIHPRVTVVRKIASWTTHPALGVPTFQEFFAGVVKLH